MTVIERPPLLSRLRPWFSGFDIPLLLAILWTVSYTHLTLPTKRIL